MTIDHQATLTVWQITGQAHSELWMFYIVAVSGAVGFSFSESFNRSGPARWALFALVLVFMISNIVSLWNNLAIYNSAVAALQSASGSIAGVDKIVPIPQLLIATLHASMDVLVLIILGRQSCAPRRAV